MAKLRIEKANLEAEEKLLACSEGSFVSTSTKSKSGSRSRLSLKIPDIKIKTVKKENAVIKERLAKRESKPGPLNVKSNIFPLHIEVASTSEVKPHFATRRLSEPIFNDAVPQKAPLLGDPKGSTLNRETDTAKTLLSNRVVSNVGDVNATPFVPVKRPVVYQPLGMNNDVYKMPQLHYQPTDNGELILRTYLDRQGRNEYINLASQIAYDGSNIAFVFYENQIRRLMNESPFEERRLEVLRASCVGQPREMVNLFCVPMKNLSTSVRIEKALDRLRQRYGVSGGLTSEPKVIAVRNGPKVSFALASLKMFNEDLNTLEVYAYAHDEVEKLSGQLLMDTANRLPNVLKRRYLDYLKRMNLNLNQPGFESLRNFVVDEISTMTSDYAQAFFRANERDSSRELSGGSKDIRVRQVVVNGESATQNAVSSYPTEPETKGGSRPPPELTRRGDRGGQQPPPVCFFCSDADCRHFLAECEKFKALNPRMKRQTVMDAKRCLNCLSLDHFVRNCKYPSKCRICGPHCRNKHTSALHECFNEVNLGAAEKVDSRPRPVPAPRSGNFQIEKRTRKVELADRGVVLLRTSAVKVINPITGKSTVAYAQHDTASQVTLISANLKSELGLITFLDPNVNIRTLADDTVAIEGRTNFKLESLHTGEEFIVNDAFVVPQFTDDVNTLPHAVDTSVLKHFDGAVVPVAPDRRQIDILIGQSDKQLLTVLDEREGANPEEPNYVLTRLGPIASGGKVPAVSTSLSALRVQVNSSADSECECTKLRQEISALKETVREFERQDEAIQPSLNDELVKELVEEHIKVINGRYEMPVPFRINVLKRLPNNYENALKRTISLNKPCLLHLMNYCVRIG